MTEPREPSPDTSSSADAEGAGLDRFVRPYFTDSTLWPVLFVLFAALSVFGAAILLFALHTRSFFALAAISLLVVTSLQAVVSELHRRRRLGLAGGSILALWGLSAGIALLALHFGLF